MWVETEARTAPRVAGLARMIGLAALGAILLFIAFLHPRIDGDGTEYMMMAHGFARHATPEIRPSDIADMQALPDAVAAPSGLLKGPLGAVPQQIEHDHTMPLGFADGKSWGIQAIHFWMYSLLAAPIHAVTAALGLNPALAFVALNCLILAATAGCILRWYPRAGVAEVAFLALMGAVLYLRWTGPEVFSACCALLATLAMLRRDPALAAALAGFGATQNPSIAGLILAAGAWRLLLALRPDWAPGPAPAPARRPLRNVALAVAGVVLAALPYVYNELVFGMPSIIAAHFTNRNLASWGRFRSLFLDLNQGLAAGLPGLLLALVLIPGLLGKAYRLRWLAYAAGAAVLTAGLSLPALITVNWNSGYIVVLRYAYWAATPLIAVCIAGLAQLPAARRWIVVGGAALCQAFAMWQSGLPHVSYLEHSRMANWVLDHAPGLYNPDPEIFAERELHKELDLPKDIVVVHRSAAGPAKLMRHWTNTADSGGICPAGQVLVSPGVMTFAGWEYFNAPFRCGADAAPGALWRFDTAHADNAPLLGAGWSHPEATAVWTEGGLSVMDIPVPHGREFKRLGIVGGYFQPSTKTDVTINGIALGKLWLGAAPVVLPEQLRHADKLHIELRHDHPVSPAALGMSADTRPLAFRMEYVYLD